MNPLAPAATPPAAANDAQTCAAILQDTMSELKSLIDLETSLVRVGDLAGTLRLEPKKSEASRRYVAAVLKARLVQPLMARLVPDVLQSLQTQHDALRAALKVNMTVLATAHAVSEGVVRGVNTEVQRRSGPQTYTNQGQHSHSAGKRAMPIAFSRVL